MRGHLTEEEISRFTAHQIKGKERVSILTHLEMCAICRMQIASPSKTEILERLNEDDRQTECDCDEKKDSIEKANE